MILAYLSMWFNDYFDGCSTISDQLEASSCLRQGQSVGDHLMYGDVLGAYKVYGSADIEGTGAIGGHEGDAVSPKLIDRNRKINPRFCRSEEEHGSPTIHRVQGLMKGRQGPGTDNNQIGTSLIVELLQTLRYIL
jgi:hypothetical protein